MSKFTSFKQFYPFYLSQHTHRACRLLHVIGSSLVIFLAIAVIFTHKWLGLLWTPVIGYGFAWAGHVLFEKNKPATFQYPLYSLMGDWVMFWNSVRALLKLSRLKLE